MFGKITWLSVPAVPLLVVMASAVASVVSERRTKVPCCASPLSLKTLAVYAILPLVEANALLPIATLSLPDASV